MRTCKHIEAVKREIAELNDLLKKHGLNRAERRHWIRTIKKEARIK